MRQFIAALTILAVAFPATANGPDPQQENAGAHPVYQFGRSLLNAGKTLAEGNELAAAVQLAKDSVDHLFPGIGADVPDWAKRIEIEADVQENNSPEWSILTVQPLWESDDLKDTVFTQVSYRRYSLFGDDRDVVNTGLGYRRLFFDNKVLIGINGFFDYGFKFHHQRTSAGFEAKWAGLDFNANRYWGISNAHSGGKSDITEEPLDGYDIELTAQIPYLPWARIRGKHYQWDTIELSEDIDGWSASAEVDLMQNLQIEAGIVSDNYINDANNHEAFVQIRFHMDLGRPVALSSKVVSDSPWLMRDMSKYRLDKVRRENRIVVERRSSGVVITRGG